MARADAALILTLFYGLEALSQQSRSQVDDYIQAYVRNGDFSGSVLIAKSGHVVFQKSYGMANYEWGIPNSEKTRFHIASVTQDFHRSRHCDAGAARQAEAERSAQQVCSRLPERRADHHRADAGSQLGLPDYYSLPEYPTKKYQRVTLPDLIAWVKTKPLDFLPGSKNSYSNTGYGFLAYIIEQVSGKRYDRFIGDEILRPAGMKDTGTLRDEALISARADGYQPALGNPGLRNAPFYEKTILTGSGSLLLDHRRPLRVVPGDRGGPLLRYPQAQLSLWLGRPRDRRASTSTSSRVAAIPGLPRTSPCFPDDDLVVIVLGNLEDAAVNVMADDLASLAFQRNPPPPAARPRTIAPIAHAQRLRLAATK